MKNSILLLLLIGFSFKGFTQILSSIADTQALINVIPFPQASATMIVSFNAKMLDITTMPAASVKRQPLDELLKRYEKDKTDINLLCDIYYAHKGKNDPQSGMSYLQMAFNKAVELYELNPSNLEHLEQMTDILIEVKRMPDVPGLWSSYTERNPEVAMGWAKLAVYQVQMMDTLGSKNSIEKAFTLDPELPEIYVAALLEVIYKMIIQMQTLGENAIIKADLSFFEKVLAQKPNSEIAKLSYNAAKLFELFYGVMIANVDKFGMDKSFKMDLTERQKTEWAELEKAFKTQLTNSKIVNKYMMLKSLLVLEVIRGEPDMAVAYLEESKKYIESDVDLYKILSFGFIPLKKYQKAIPYLKTATDLSSNFDDFFALARLYFENHEYSMSMDILEMLLQSFPKKTDIVMGMISIKMREGKFQEACSTLFRLQELYQDEMNFEDEDPYFPFYKAICTLVYSKNKAEAQKTLQAVIDKDLPWSEEAKELMKRFF